MKSDIAQNTESRQNEIVQSLLYLYQETLRGNMQELSHILQTTIESCGRVKNASSQPLSSGDILKQFYILREFQRLDDRQKELFLQKIEDLQPDSLAKNPIAKIHIGKENA